MDLPTAQPAAQPRLNTVVLIVLIVGAVTALGINAVFLAHRGMDGFWPIAIFTMVLGAGLVRFLLRTAEAPVITCGCSCDCANDDDGADDGDDDDDDAEDALRTQLLRSTAGALRAAREAHDAGFTDAAARHEARARLLVEEIEEHDDIDPEPSASILERYRALL